MTMLLSFILLVKLSTCIVMSTKIEYGDFLKYEKIMPGRCTGINPNVKLLPHEYDCGSYYMCESGKAISKKCPGSLHFNQKKNVCDYPDRAGCLKEEITTSEIMPGICPRINPAMVKLLPHENDCGSYYMCESGKAISKKCPGSLHFNPKKNVCDYPDRAGCLKEEKSTSVPLVKTGFTSEVTGKPSPFCPSIDGSYPKFFRHHTNCSVYYMCGNGLAYKFVCPSGLHFNLGLQVCDWPYRAGCLRSLKQSGSTATYPVCPAKSSDVTAFLPHSSDCAQYFICVNGNPVLRKCPAGLHFNKNKKTCDYPENAGCAEEDESL